MKKMLCLVFFTTVLTFKTITINAQVKFSKDIKVTTSAPYQVQDGSSKEYFYDDKGSALLIKTDGKKKVIQKFSVDGMKEISRKEFEDFPDKMQLQKVLKVGSRIFYIYTAVNKKDKNETLYAREINQAEGSFMQPKELFTTDKQVMVSSYADNAGIFSAGIKYNIYTSFDGSKLMVNYRTKPESKSDAKNFDVLGFYIFDIALTKIWGGEVKMPYTEKEMNNLAYTVTKNGKAQMLAYINETKTLELFTISSDLVLMKNKIDAGANLVFQSFTLKETIDGNINCMAYYANGVDFKVSWQGNMTTSLNVNGLINFKITQDGKVLEKFNYDFPIELINQYESKRARAKNEKREDKGNAGIADLKIVEVTANEDGSSTVLGEQQYIKVEGFGNNRKNYYYYADMVMMKIDAKGKLQWMKKLPKTQYGIRGKGAMGVKYINGKNFSYIVYLDVEKNKILSKDDAPEEYVDGSDGFFVAYKITKATGELEKIFIVNTDDINGIEAFQFKPSRIFEVSPNNFLLEVYIKGKQDMMVKMNLGN